MTEETDATTTKRTTPDKDLLHGGSGVDGPRDHAHPIEEDDDLLNGGSGENEPDVVNEPPIERNDGQVYGG